MWNGGVKLKDILLMKVLVRFAKLRRVWIKGDWKHKVNSSRPERGGLILYTFQFENTAGIILFEDLL
jgi:hypothetical protein